MVMYNTSFLREQEEKKRYKGRGKYKRTINQYFIDMYDMKGKHLVGGIAFGYGAMLLEKRKMRHRVKDQYHTRYRVKIYNNTKQKWIKK